MQFPPNGGIESSLISPCAKGYMSASPMHDPASIMVSEPKSTMYPLPDMADSLEYELTELPIFPLASG
jgi:hypothetical protein